MTYENEPERELEELRERVSKLEEEVAELEDEIYRLEEENYELNRENDELLERLEGSSEEFNEHVYDALLEFYRAYARGEDITNAKISVVNAIEGRNILI